MTVALLPPIASGGLRINREAVVKVGPSFIRPSSPNGRYWHRPRSGVRYDHGISWWCWCGVHLFDKRCYSSDTPPTEEPVCGTCEGRAFGSGQLVGDTEYATEFRPQGIDPPKVCPGSGASGLFRDIGRTAVGRFTGVCLVCGAVEKCRAMGGSPYRSTWGITKHPPAGDIIPVRCDFHGWRRLTQRDGRVICSCEETQWPQT